MALQMSLVEYSSYDLIETPFIEYSSNVEHRISKNVLKQVHSALGTDSWKPETLMIFLFAFVRTLLRSTIFYNTPKDSTIPLWTLFYNHLLI